MADNTPLNPGSGGDLIATDELATINGGAAPAGLKVQRVKVGHGADGAFTDASAANPLPVTTGVQTGSGPVTATTQRVTLATDGPTVSALTSIDSKTPALVGGASPVSVAALPLPAGASTEATLSALNSAVAALNALAAEQKDANDTMLGLLSAILEKMPSLTSGDRMRVAVTLGESANELNSGFGGVSTNLVGEATGGRTFSRMLEPANFADMGAKRLYDQIIVT